MLLSVMRAPPVAPHDAELARPRDPRARGRRHVEQQLRPRDAAADRDDPADEARRHGERRARRHAVRSARADQGAVDSRPRSTSRTGTRR